MTAAPKVVDLKGARRLRQDGTRRFELEVPAFALGAGERVALVGRSGSGKSSLIEILAVAAKPDALQAFSVQHPDEAQPRDIARAWSTDDDAFLSASRARCFGYVQQIGGLLGFLTVRRNIELSMTICGARDDEAVARIAEALGIARHLDAFPVALSVGERQRVAIARALVHAPAIVLADEPTGALDIATAEQVMGQLAAIAETRGTALILATHDRALAQAFGFRLVEAEVVIEDERQWSRFTCQAA